MHFQSKILFIAYHTVGTCSSNPSTSPKIQYWTSQKFFFNKNLAEQKKKIDIGHHKNLLSFFNLDTKKIDNQDHRNLFKTNFSNIRFLKLPYTCLYIVYTSRKFKNVSSFSFKANY